MIRLGFTYPLHVDKHVTLTVHWNDGGYTEWRVDRKRVFKSDIAVMRASPAIRNAAIDRLRASIGETTREIDMLARLGL